MSTRGKQSSKRRLKKRAAVLEALIARYPEVVKHYQNKIKMEEFAYKQWQIELTQARAKLNNLTTTQASN